MWGFRALGVFVLGLMVAFEQVFAEEMLTRIKIPTQSIASTRYVREALELGPSCLHEEAYHI